MSIQCHKISLPVQRFKLLSLQAIGVLFICAIFTACSQPPFLQEKTAPTPTLGVIQPSPTPTLPPLAADTGWHTVLTLGYTGGTVDRIGGDFTATKPFSILFSCEGSGQIAVAFSPVAQPVPLESQTAPCGASPQPNAVMDRQPTTPGEGVHVVVTTEGSVVWEALVEMQN